MHLAPPQCRSRIALDVQIQRRSNADPMQIALDLHFRAGALRNCIGFAALRNCKSLHADPMQILYVSMYLRIYVSMYQCISVSMYLCIYVAMLLCMHVCIYVYIYIYIYVSMCVCVHVCMYVCMHACMCVRTYVCSYR